MATASSAQREPSMEEILASIRRIIEDSDPGRKLPDDAAELMQDLEPVQAEMPEAEVETFRAELRTAPQMSKPFTLADVQARIKAEQLSLDADKTPAYEAAASTSSPMGLPQASAVEPYVAYEPAAPALDSVGEASATIVADWRRDIEAAGQRLDALPPVESRQPQPVQLRADIEAFEEEQAVHEGPSSVQPDPISVDEEPAGRPSIVSEQTGRQVAAAFGELSEAFAARSRKSFDETAEEMLRPMLQDWLDNNLPTLVERLVREEIERVARGA